VASGENVCGLAIEAIMVNDVAGTLAFVA